MSKVHFILDEFAALGHLDSIDDALGLGRGYGIRLQFYLQAVSQLKKCSPPGGEQTLLSNTTNIFFAVNDNETAAMVSARCGEKTIIVDSGGTNSGTSEGASFGRERGTNKGFSQGKNANWTLQARKMLNPDELMVQSPRIATTFVPGMPPISTTLVRYYEQNLCPGWFGRVCHSLLHLVKAAVLCALALGIAALLTKAIGTKARPPVHRQMNVFQE